MNHDKDETARIMQEIADAAGDAHKAIEAVSKIVQETMKTIIEAWEALAALVVEAENTTAERARKPLRPVKSTINRQYKQPVKVVHRTARSRLR